MWFKTHVGLIGVVEPSEILVGQSADSGPKRWWIYARLKYQQEATFKGLIGSGTFSNPVSYLAMFSDGPAVGQAVAECMAQIEVSLRAKAEVCDLSRFGDAQAWSKNWNPVQWQSRGEPDA